MTATITSRLVAKASASVTFDPPLPVAQYGRDVFVDRAHFQQHFGSTQVYATGSGFYAKKDGTPGKQKAYVHNLRLQDLPDDVRARVERHLTRELAQITQEV